MKRFNSSDSLAALTSISEVKNQKANQGYSKEFQAMLDSLEEEDYAEEGSHIIGKKRRLTLDQVNSLEKNFEVENKLEPERKLKLAEELGLQPRQVAIWFQNRRARWKIKKMEREYGNLKANYEALKLDYNNLEKENEALVLKLKELKAKLREENAESSQSVKVKEEYPLSESENNVSGQCQNHDFNENNYPNEIIAEHINASSAHGLMNLFSTEDSCNFFSVDQAPTLHWYFPEQQN